MTPTAAPSAGASAAENAAVPRDRAGRFGKGNPGHRLRVAAAERGEAPVPASKLLQAMRHTATQPEARDRTQLQRECRAWLKEDKRGFLGKLCDLEKALTNARARRASPGGPGGGQEGAVGLPADPSSGQAEGLIQQLLAEAGWTVEQEREACAELAAAKGAGPAVVQAIRGRKWGPNG